MGQNEILSAQFPGRQLTGVCTGTGQNGRLRSRSGQRGWRCFNTRTSPALAIYRLSNVHPWKIAGSRIVPGTLLTLGGSRSHGSQASFCTAELKVNLRAGRFCTLTCFQRTQCFEEAICLSGFQLLRQ